MIARPPHQTSHPIHEATLIASRARTRSRSDRLQGRCATSAFLLPVAQQLLDELGEGRGRRLHGRHVDHLWGRWPAWDLRLARHKLRLARLSTHADDRLVCHEIRPACRTRHAQRPQDARHIWRCWRYGRCFYGSKSGSRTAAASPGINVVGRQRRQTKAPSTRCL